MSRSILSLDIRNEGTTALRLETGIKGPWIEGCVYIPTRYTSEGTSDLAATLAVAAEEMDISGAAAIVALPAEHITIRNIQVPFKEKKKISQVLPFELEPMLPQPVDGLVIDFHTAGSSENGGITQVVAAGIEITTLNDYTEALSSRGIRPKSITIGGCALAAAMGRYADTPADWMIVDVDPGKATIIGVSSGKVCFVRALPERTGEAPSAATITRGIRHILLSAEEVTHVTFDPNLLFLSTNLPETEDLAANLSAAFDFPVEQTDLLRRPDVLKQPFTGSTEGMSIDIALAMALAEAEGTDLLNLRKGPLPEANFWRENKKRLVQSGILAAGALLLMASYHAVDAYRVKQQIAGLDRQIAQTFKTSLPQGTPMVKPLEQMQRELNETKKKAGIPDSPRESIPTIDILNQISTGIPKETDVQLTRLVIGDGTIQITGDTDTFNAVDGMKSRLEQATSFETVTITSATMDKSGSRVRFKLKVELRSI